MARIMVVDDEDIVRNFIKKVLEADGYEVSEAANGRLALSSFRKNPVDLVITDIVMPEKEGLETIKEFRQAYPGLKIIGISGGGRVNSMDYLEIAQHFGADRTFAKPFKWPELLAAIRELLSD